MSDAALLCASLRLLRGLGLLERRCAHCLTPFTPRGDEAFCPRCLPPLAPYRGAACPCCGLPLPPADRANAPSVPCGRCLSAPPPWADMLFYGLYEGTLRDCLLRLKFSGELALAGPLGALLAKHLQHARPTARMPDCVLAVPQHPVHLRERGYNQAHELAAALCRELRLPLRHDLLRRTRRVSPQAGLDAAQRAANVHGSFAADARQLAGAHCWLLDDVMTTGSTARAACTALLEAGAASVTLLVMARTPSR